MVALFESRERADGAAEKLKVYAQPQRLMILSCLLVGERTVSEIDKVTAIGQPALSQQLAELRRANLVNTRKEGKQDFYQIADSNVALCVRTMEAMLTSGTETGRALEQAIRGKPAGTASAPKTGAVGFARILD